MSQRKTFASLRPAVTVRPAGEDDSIERVLNRISASRDGDLFKTWLREECLAPSHPSASDAVLREAEGKRRAYSDLIDMLEGTAPVR